MNINIPNIQNKLSRQYNEDCNNMINFGLSASVIKPENN